MNLFTNYVLISSILVNRVFCGLCKNDLYNLFTKQEINTPTIFASKNLSPKIMDRKGSFQEYEICEQESYRTILFNAFNCYSKQIVSKIKYEETAFIENNWKKNFASTDCGAKIVLSSNAIQNVAHAISRSKDEYMLSECAKSVWFTIELCETINILRFELENHELYSGSLQMFRMSAAHKFTSKSWQDLGNFTSTGNKKFVETFYPANNETFGRFVNVEILTNHGDEHFCTLTSFRVFGRTEYEFLAEDENQDSEANLLHPAIVDLPKSVVGDKLNKISVMSRHTTISDKYTRATNVVENYKYYYLNLRKDTCTDEMTVNMMQTTRTIESSISYPSNGEKNKVKDERNNKESILVGLNSRLKTMEKNATITSFLLKQLNHTVSVHTNDMERILEAVIKAKESFQETIKEMSSFRNKLKIINENEIKHDKFLKDSSQNMKLLVMGFLFLTLFTLHTVCNMDARFGSSEEVKLTKETGTMTQNMIEIKSVENKPDRRTTWCGRTTKGILPYSKPSLQLITEEQSFGRVPDKNLSEETLFEEVLDLFEKELPERKENYLEEKYLFQTNFSRHTNDVKIQRRATWCGTG